MRLLKFSAALAAIALPLSLTALPALADTNSDLGIDVSQVPPDVPDVNAFLATLSPDTQAILHDTCANYVTDPNGNDIRSPDTMPFCEAAVAGAQATVAGPAGVRSFATTSPLVITRPVGGAPGGHSYNVF